jgi:hypothetical protein
VLAGKIRITADVHISCYRCANNRNPDYIYYPFSGDPHFLDLLNVGIESGRLIPSISHDTEHISLTVVSFRSYNLRADSHLDSKI